MAVVLTRPPSAIPLTTVETALMKHTKSVNQKVSQNLHIYTSNNYDLRQQSLGKTDSTCIYESILVYFYENCGQEIHVYDAVHLKLKRSGASLIPNTACDNIVVAHSKSQGIGAPAQVYAHFRSINLPQPTGGNCTAARIDIYDGLRVKTRISGMDDIYCIYS
jgi:hypothetical protein